MISDLFKFYLEAFPSEVFITIIVSLAAYALVVSALPQEGLNKSVGADYQRAILPLLLASELVKSADRLVSLRTLSLRYQTELEKTLNLESAVAWIKNSMEWDSSDMEALASTIVSLLPKFIYKGSGNPSSGRAETSQRQLLAQAEATVHRPTGFASSPSLPGTISSPWWTDFAHLVYWFYFFATFTTVAFLWYLYDFRVRRVETAHPIRETRGFSRAQTGDLVTAVLPLTWSATMVMHASTHSINFDENTAGTAFSFTVVAYQWGWNYYFPRDIVTQLEAAPKVVGRGRVISFETTPFETLQNSHWDSWALRATTGSSHGSRSGRLNTSSALSLILPTDIPAGHFSSFSAPCSKGLHWRKALAAALNDINNPPYNPTLSEPNSEAAMEFSFSSGATTLWRPKASVYASGPRLTLAYRHLAPQLVPISYSSASWVTANLCGLEGDDTQTRAERPYLSVLQAPGLPTIDNISGAPGASLAPINTSPLALDLNHLRGPLSPSTQHLVWTGPEALTGAGFTSLGSTEDHGWTSPVTARESALRSALSVKSSASLFIRSTPSTLSTANPSSMALLLPFDINARFVLNHTSSPLASLPFTWTLASTALESDIETASLGHWANALIPDLSQTALCQPATLLSRQKTQTSLKSLLAPSAPGLAPFMLTPASAAPQTPSLRAASPAPLASFVGRPRFELLAVQLKANLSQPKAYPLILAMPRMPRVGFIEVVPSRPSVAHDLYELLSEGPKCTLVPKIVFFHEPACLRLARLMAPSLRMPLLQRPSRGHMGHFSLEGGSLKPQPSSRTRFVPSSIGLGLDENRLVRVGTSRLADSSMIGNKLENPGLPPLALPSSPLAALGLGWSTTASLSSYPSYKISRGGLFRRPFTGLTPQQRPLEGLKESFSPLSFSKNLSHLGMPLLTLVKPAMPKFYTAPASLDTQIGSWSPVWAVLTPAPTEDLDPTFINTTWTPEVNTTRRSDHNSRYLVSWSPLLGSITSRSPLSLSLSGPSARSSQSPSLLRSSILALNELGLKNSYGSRNVKPVLLQSETLEGRGSSILNAQPSSAVAPALAAPKWPALWGALPYPSTTPFAASATQLTPDKISGRSAALLTSRNSFLRSGAVSPVLSHIGGGDKLSPLTDALAKLEFSILGSSQIEIRPRQGYIPLSSDISASRRLRVTKGVTLPSDTPMHAICGSKDVIHSWAIPGLNIKIDCIPGYNSHRRLLLRWRGAYWGQCMEVCGRYHHWMPIMLNVVHPALFVDWCLTFLRGLDSQAMNGPATLPPFDIKAFLKGASKSA